MLRVHDYVWEGAANKPTNNLHVIYCTDNLTESGFVDQNHLEVKFSTVQIERFDLSYYTITIIYIKYMLVSIFIYVLK